jgi:hypothetical protein
VTIIDYIPQHFLQIQRRPEEEGLIEVMFGIGEVAVRFADGPAATLIHEGNAVGALGIVPLWKGVGEAWTLVSPWLLKRKFSLYRISRRLLYETALKMNLDRVQCDVDLMVTGALEWAYHMGFGPEGIMEGYFNGMDYVRFGCIRGKDGRYYRSGQGGNGNDGIG